MDQEKKWGESPLSGEPSEAAAGDTAAQDTPLPAQEEAPETACAEPEQAAQEQETAGGGEDSAAEPPKQEASEPEKQNAPVWPQDDWDTPCTVDVPEQTDATEASGETEMPAAPEASQAPAAPEAPSLEAPHTRAWQTPPPAYQQPGTYQQPGAYQQQPYPGQAGQPHPWQQPGYGMPPRPPYGGSYSPYGQYSVRPPKPPRRPASAGVRLFVVILGVIVLGSLVGLGIAAVDRTLTGMSADDFPIQQWNEENPLLPQDPTTPDETPSTPENPDTPDGWWDSFDSLTLPEVVYRESGITIQSRPDGDPLSSVEVYQRCVDSVVSVNVELNGEVSEGSGIVLSSDGYIVTNSHVVLDTNESRVLVKLHDGTQYPAVVIGYEKNADIAVLRVDAQNLQAAEFGNASQIQVGERVYAIGNPGGERYGSTLTGGFVSGLNRELDQSAANGLTYIQTDAAINPGNSGGALVNEYGQVVGINSNKVVSTYYEGIGFAIPISDASNIISDLMTRGYVSGRSRLGVMARTVTEVQAEASGIPTGVMIVSVDDDSPLKGIAFTGDVITEAAGQEITSLEDLYAVLRTHSGGESITVTIYSPGSAETPSSEKQYTIVLLEDTGETQQ